VNRVKTAFLKSIGKSLDEVILIFLNLIDGRVRQAFKIGCLRDNNGRNPFHFANELEEETFSTLLERLPFSDQLVNLGDSEGKTPLQIALSSMNAALVEKFLRTGCRTDVTDTIGDSPLKKFLFLWERVAINKNWVAYMIEMLLSFGVDLQKELYLYTDEELPDEFRDPNYENQRRTTGIQDQSLLLALQALRRSNAAHPPSLKQICRSFIRNHLKPNIDEKIKSLEPGALTADAKSFLLVELEKVVLNWHIVDGDIVGVDSVEQTRFIKWHVEVGQFVRAEYMK